MEKEVSALTMICVAMCTLAVLLSIVLYTVTIGDGVKGDTYERASDMQVNTESGTLKELRGQDKEMSIAAIFGIIQNTDDYIGNIDVSRVMISSEWGSGTTKSESIRYIQNNISGRARLAVEYDANLGYFNLTLHKTSCENVYDGCSCN